MNTSIIDPTTPGEIASRSASRSTSSTKSSTGELQRGNFMDLLLLQLRSQDPMSPMDSAAMFNQMAQLSVLEQLWDMRDMMAESAATSQLSQGAALIGRQVEANSIESGHISGLVDGVRMQSGTVWLQVGKDEVRMEEVVSVQ